MRLSSHPCVAFLSDILFLLLFEDGSQGSSAWAKRLRVSSAPRAAVESFATRRSINFFQFTFRDQENQKCNCDDKDTEIAVSLISGETMDTRLVSFSHCVRLQKNVAKYAT